MKSKKLKATIYIGILLWVVAFVQIGMTQLLYSETNISQAFTRNQLEVVSTGVECKAKLGEKVIDKKAWKKEFGKNSKVDVKSIDKTHYMHAKVNTDADLETMQKTKEKLRSFVKENKLDDYEILTFVECQYRGMMSSEKKEKLVERLFRQCGALTVTKKETDDYFVAYGYTLGEQDSVEINGRKVNINIAINYDEGKGITRIFIGTPLLNVDF